VELPASLGRLRIGSFTLGTVLGTLLAGVLIGQLDIPALGPGRQQRPRLPAAVAS